jgi:hypothetical protein
MRGIVLALLSVVAACLPGAPQPAEGLGEALRRALADSGLVVASWGPGPAPPCAGPGVGERTGYRAWLTDSTVSPARAAATVRLACAYPSYTYMREERWEFARRAARWRLTRRTLLWLT